MLTLFDHVHTTVARFFPDLSRTYTQDGVCLTESGLCQLQSLSATASRRRKPKPKLKLKIINQNSVAVLQAPLDPPSEHSRDEDMEDNRGTFEFMPSQVFLINEDGLINELYQSVVEKTVSAAFCVHVDQWRCSFSQSLKFLSHSLHL